MSTVNKFVTSGIMILFALALTLLYIPDAVVSIYEAGETSDLIAEIVGIALNGSMCIGAWILAIKASYTGARIVRIISVIKQWGGWLGIAGFVLMLFLGFDGFEMTEYPELNFLVYAVYALLVLTIAALVVDIFISKNIARMMQNIMYRMSGGRPYGYLVTLDNWSIAGLIIVGVTTAVMLCSFFMIHRLFNSYGIRIENLNELGLGYGSVFPVLFVSAAQVFSYIVFIKLTRGFGEFVIQDDAEKDAADAARAEEIAEEVAE